MAPFVPLVHGAQVDLGFVFAGKVVTNRLWFIKDDPPIVPLDLSGLVDGVISWYTSEMLPYLSHDIEFKGARATKWDSTPGDISEITLMSAFGGVAEKSYSANVALRVGFRWPLNQRHRLNCHFVPGIPDSFVTLNTPDPLAVYHYWNAYVDLIDAARLFSPLFEWRWVVTSAWQGGVLRAEQAWGECIGPVDVSEIRVAQRRTRLP